MAIEMKTEAFKAAWLAKERASMNTRDEVHIWPHKPTSSAGRLRLAVARLKALLDSPTWKSV